MFNLCIGCILYVSAELSLCLICSLKEWLILYLFVELVVSFASLMFIFVGCLFTINNYILLYDDHFECFSITVNVPLESVTFVQKFILQNYLNISKFLCF